MRPAALACTLLLAACASGPPPPDWQVDAQQSVEAAMAAYLQGDSAGEARQFERARGAVARTGNPGQAARVELMRCAAHVASLVFEPCAGFERWRVDADAPERAYADYLGGRLRAEDVKRLPPAQQPVAGAAGKPDAAHAALKDMRDPLSRLVAAAVLFQRAEANPATIALAVDTASGQGWRRPLLAWLQVQLARAQQAGDAGEAERLRRRIELAQGR
jgi:hypothetical protein